jgi:hypothetical protein
MHDVTESSQPVCAAHFIFSKLFSCQPGIMACNPCWRRRSTAHFISSCAVIVQCHDANIVFGLGDSDNTSTQEKDRFFQQCMQGAAIVAEKERIPTEEGLGAMHRSVLTCLRRQRGLKGCSITPEVLQPFSAGFNLPDELLASANVNLTRVSGAVSMLHALCHPQPCGV